MVFAFLFSVASWPHLFFVTENQILIWSYSKCFGVCWQGFSRNASLGSIGRELFMRNSWFCILVRYCNIVTPILKSKISLLRLIAEELWNIRRSFDTHQEICNECEWVCHSWKNISADRNFFHFSHHQLQFQLVYQCMIVGMRKC